MKNRFHTHSRMTERILAAPTKGSDRKRFRRELDFSRRWRLPIAVLWGFFFSMAGVAFAAEKPCDRRVPQSDAVLHEKVSHSGRQEITLVADRYMPKDRDRAKRVPVNVVDTSHQKTERDKTMNEASMNSAFPKGAKGPADYFTGTTWVNMLVTDDNNVFDTQAYDVRFEPKARTYWHSHPGGQLLFVTNGKGYYQEKGKPARRLQKGEVVEIPPEVVHWHGAAPDSPFVHLGVSTKNQLGPADWSGEVTDEEYEEATSQP